MKLIPKSPREYFRKDTLGLTKEQIEQLNNDYNARLNDPKFYKARRAELRRLEHRIGAGGLLVGSAVVVGAIVGFCTVGPATYGSLALFGAAIGAGLGAAIATGSFGILGVCASMTYRHYSQCSREYRSQRDEMLEQNKKAKDLLSPRSSLIGNIEANPLESNDLQIQHN